jgi:1-acyl-sn-glycerol-3-phosphate acyltransferase
MAMIYNILQAVAYIVFYFPSHFFKPSRNRLRHYYRKCQEFLAHWFAGFLIVVLEMKSGMKPVFYGDSHFFRPEHPIQNAVFISNHTSYADWVVLYSAALRHGSAGQIRFFLKDLAKFLPGIGWACCLHDFFLVNKTETKGNWKRDGTTILDRYQSFKDSNSSIWPTIFVEGTFHDGAVPNLVEKTQSFAKDRGLPVLDYVLTPRTRGFVSCVTNLRGHVTHIVDQTMAFTGNADPTCDRKFVSCLPLNDESRVLPDIVDLSSFRGPQHVHIHVTITPIDDLPEDDEGIQQWVHDRWKAKDDMLRNFHKTGKFPGNAKRVDLELFGKDMMIKYLAFWFSLAAAFTYGFLSMPWFVIWNVLMIVVGGGLIGVLVNHFYKDK